MRGAPAASSVGGMKGQAVVAALVALVATPSVAAAYPDWRSPERVGVPQEGVLRFPQALAYDASGVDDPGPGAPRGPYVYVADQHTFFVQKFTADGRFVRRFGGYGSDAGHLGATSASASPTTGTVGGVGGVAVDARGRVYVLDSFNNRIERFSPGGEFQGQWGAQGAAPGQLDPGINGGIALSGDYLYVADQDNHRVQRFQLGADGWPDGAAPLVYGSLGSGPGQFNFVQDVGVDPARDHDVFAADDRNDRVHRLSAGLAFRSFIGAGGQLDSPYATAMDLAGRLFVADNAHMRVARFDDGAFTLGFGGPGVQPGQLNNVRAVAVAPNADAAGGVFATNTSLNDISEFGVDGAFIRRWGGDGRGPARVHAAARRRGRAQRRHRRHRYAHGPPAGAACRRARRNVGAYQRRARRAGQRRGPARVPGPERRGHRPAQWRRVGRRGRPPPCPADPAGRRQVEGHDLWRELGGHRSGALHRAARRRRRGRRHGVGGRHAQRSPTAPRSHDQHVVGARRVRPPDRGRGADRRADRGDRARRPAHAAHARRRRARRELDGLDHPEGVASDGHGGVLVADTQEIASCTSTPQLARWATSLAAGRGRWAWTSIRRAACSSPTPTAIASCGCSPRTPQPGGAGGTVAPALVLRSAMAAASSPSRPASRGPIRRRVNADVLSTADDATLTRDRSQPRRARATSSTSAMRSPSRCWSPARRCPRSSRPGRRPCPMTP